MDSLLAVIVFSVLFLHTNTQNNTKSNFITLIEPNSKTPKEFKKSYNKPSYTPTWPSLDSRPLPLWYDDFKIGVKFAWGVFSVPSFHGEWFWYDWKGYKYSDVVSFMEKNYPPNFTYPDFARDFTTEFFNPYEWVDLIIKSGAKYIVFNGKHHDGYTMWPSKYSFGWNAKDVGPGRDVLGEMAEALRNKTNTIKFGIYHSLFEFYNPIYLEDKKNGFKTDGFVRKKTFPELKELVINYHPDIVWSDGDWEADDDYWKSKEFLAWLYNSSPVKDTVVVNDRWGRGTGCKHGGFYNCQDRYNPGVLQHHKWENVLSVDKISWGYRRNALLNEYHTPQELITELVTTVACGGNFLLNVGPTKEGTISPILQERLIQMGTWLGINGESIYGTIPWTKAQNDSVSNGVWYTSKPKEKKLFAILMENNWPRSTGAGDQGKLILGSVDSRILTIDNIQILGFGFKNDKVSWIPCDGIKCKLSGILVTLPIIPPNSQNKWGWTLQIKYI